MIELIRTKQAGMPAQSERAPARPDALMRSSEADGGKMKPAKRVAAVSPPAGTKRKAAKG